MKAYQARRLLLAFGLAVGLLTFRLVGTGPNQPGPVDPSGVDHNGVTTAVAVSPACGGTGLRC